MIAPMLVFEDPCNCPICQCRRTLWEDTVAAVAEHFDLDDAEATLHVQTYAPTLPRMVQ
jgi:hypothetical protein